MKALFIIIFFITSCTSVSKKNTNSNDLQTTGMSNLPKEITNHPTQPPLFLPNTTLLAVGMGKSSPTALIVENKNKQPTLWLLNLNDSSRLKINYNENRASELTNLTYKSFNNVFCENTDRVYFYDKGDIISFNLTDGSVTRTDLGSTGSTPIAAIITEVDGKCRIIHYRWTKEPPMIAGTPPISGASLFDLQGIEIKDLTNFIVPDYMNKSEKYFYSGGLKFKPSVFEVTFKVDKKTNKFNQPKISFYNLLKQKKEWTLSPPSFEHNNCYIFAPAVSLDEKLAIYTCSDYKSGTGPIVFVIIDLEKGKVIKKIQMTDEKIGIPQIDGGITSFYANSEIALLLSVENRKEDSLTQYFLNFKTNKLEFPNFYSPFVTSDLTSVNEFQIFANSERNKLASINPVNMHIQKKYDLPEPQQKQKQKLILYNYPLIFLRGNTLIYGQNYEDSDYKKMTAINMIEL